MAKPLRPIDKIVNPIQKLIFRQRAGGIMLLISVIAAMALANSPWEEHYFLFFQQKLGFIINGKSYLESNILHWINDGLMAMFFFFVGLELKREIMYGELSSLRKAILPIVAAVGGMVVPASIFYFFNPSGEPHQGWGIPMATDIAFALGVLYLLGSRVPLSLKIFLTALAIVDDLGAVIVIALFYTSEISVMNLAIGLMFLLIMFVANKVGVRNNLFYAIIGIGGVWLAFLLSGVHATIAAVLGAFMIPADATYRESVYMRRMKIRLKHFARIECTPECTLTHNQVQVLEGVKADTNAALPPLQRLEYSMGPFVVLVVLPVFALANAGVSLSGVNFSTLFSSNVTIGVFFGLLVGKVVGVVGVSMLFVKLKIAVMPKGMNFRRLLGLGFLAAIGFTMSLFITTLAFTSPEYQVQAKVGIFSASIVGGIFGYYILKSSHNSTKS